MSRFDIDLTTVPQLLPLPAGVYILRIVGHKEGTATTGNPKIVWETQVLQPAEVAARIPKHYFSQYLSENSLFRLTQLYAACGKLQAGGFDPVDLYGCEFGVEIAVEETPEYGRRNRQQRFMPASATTPHANAEEIVTA